MPKLYEYETNYHRTTEKLAVSECGQGIYIGVNSVVEMPFGEENEQTTSIVIPFSEGKTLIQSLAPTVYGKDTVLIELNGHQIKALISSLALSMDVLDGEVEQEAMPYDLLDVLKVELDALIQRDKQSEEDA